MCKLYVQADPHLYEPRQRSVRIHGVITSIRLENLMWRVLSDIASEQKCTTNGLITKLYDEATTHRSELANFASFLRVTCVRHLLDSGRLVRERSAVRLDADEDRWDVEESQAASFAH
ncbi:ribbon-helix-helix domain-containing protein [Methylibium sp.]|uniref:ribbon-helix-helix domain-containing protein n=1 Tax=Methylibium sp. TaxID=2067992 RepID=UPI003D0B4446